MKHFLLIPALALSLSACDSGQTGQSSSDTAQPVAEAPAPKYSAQAFFDTTTFSPASGSGQGFSPDGSKVLISSDETGIFNAYAVDAATGERAQLTNSTTSATFGVTYFLSDERILFTADGGGDELNHVWVRELDGTVTDLTPTENTKAAFVGWNADGDEFYISTNERDAKAFDLYAYKTDGYDRRMVFENTEALALSSLSRDDRYLAMTMNRTSADSNVYLKDLASDAAPVLVTEHEGNIAYGTYGFSVNGKLILSSNEAGEFTEAYAYDIETGDKKPYVTADWDVWGVSYSNSGRYRVETVNVDAETKVTVRDGQTGEPIVMPDLPAGNVVAVRFDPDDSHIGVASV